MTEAEYLDGLKADLIRAVRAELAARDDRPLLRIPDLARRLGVSDRAARALVDRGRIASFKIGDGIRVVAPAAVDEYVRRRQATEGDPDG